MKKIKLVYWNELNLGDLLSPYIVSKLSGFSIKHKSFYLIGPRRKLGFVLKLLSGKISTKDFSDTLFFFERNLIAIGSILSCGNKRSVIWGSGFMNWNDSFKGGNVLAVRGKLTNKKLISMGFKGCNVFGDPAFLLPLIISPVQNKVGDVVIIPHWTEVEYFQKKYGEQYKVLDIRTADVETFIAELISFRFVLSTSLHGIILSHAYGIPALWIKKGFVETDGFKFHDYFSSVDIPFYDGIEDFDSYLKKNIWKALFTEYEKYMLPYKKIRDMQKDLLRVAPFNVLSKYKI